MVQNNFYIKGNKTLLSPFLATDISDIYISWLNDPFVMRFSNQRFITHSMQSCLRYQTSFNETDNLFMGIRSLSDKKLIGTLTAYISRNHGTADLGIMIGDHSVWGSGYGLDAWSTMIDWLLRRAGIRKLTAGTLACNLGMIMLMERSGMILEGVRKSQELIEGQPFDMLYYAKFNDDRDAS